MAGLYEIWRDPSRAEDDPDRFLWSCTVITTDAPDDLGRIHDRMPLVLARAAWNRWLDPELADPADLLTAWDEADGEQLELRPVSVKVNSVKNDDPSLIEPVEAIAAVIASQPLF